MRALTKVVQLDDVTVVWKAFLMDGGLVAKLVALMENNLVATAAVGWASMMAVLLGYFVAGMKDLMLIDLTVL